jgi:O-acetyl-ADP-ribose deacetylase (regulator of RNase III)
LSVGELRTCRCDLTDLAVDAIVVPANHRLSMDSGLAADVKRLGGDFIETAAQAQLAVAVGEAVVTSAGRLPAKNVIHAVVVDDSGHTNPGIIRTATRNALRLANMRGFKTVAFPPVGADVAGFPLEEAARITAQAIRDELSLLTSLREVTLAAPDEATQAVFEEYVNPAGERIFPINELARMSANRNYFLNPISIVGATMALFAVAIIVVLFILNLTGILANPYTGILAFMVGPAVLVLGLVLIPIGVILERRRGPRERLFPVINLNDQADRRKAIFFSIATFAVLLIMAIATYQATSFMETTTFCGDTCHTVMEPEKVAHDESSHARVTCTACHIGPGAEWYVRSKITGIGQVLAVTFNTYERPIPVPIQSLRPAESTCEECHWPEQFHGNSLRVFPQYASDEKNTATIQTMVFRVGGAAQGLGIHWHTAAQVWYLPLDAARLQIGWVKVQRLDGSVAEYVLPTAQNQVTPERIQSDQRFMDCIDCHNRAAHAYPSLSRSVDGSMYLGMISPSLPYIKKEAVDAMGQINGTPDRTQYDQALQRIDAIEGFYQTQYPQVYQSSSAQVKQAVTQIRGIYQSAVFPDMNVNPDTYPEFRSHTGCFRCHGTLVGTTGSVAGQMLSNDCTLCHFQAPAGSDLGGRPPSS